LSGTLTTPCADDVPVGIDEALVGDAGAPHPTSITKLNIPDAMNKAFMGDLLRCDRKSPVVSPHSA
jgi:hypothetical protein